MLGIGSWRDVFAVLAVIGIVYGALVALAQTDFKFVIGYSSVSHMGFVLLGLVTLKQIGVTGAVLQMFSHGVIAGLLFAIVGRIVYERTHTRQLAELETMHLGKRLPFAAWAFVIAGMASMGLPGFSGFVAELQVLVGAWIAKPWWTAAAASASWSAWRIRGARCRRHSSATDCRRQKSIRRTGWPEVWRQLHGPRLRERRCWWRRL